MTKIRYKKIESWQDEALQQLNLFIHTSHPENLHEARVMMKKILASAKLHSHITGKRNSCFKEWKTISSLAGEVRLTGIINKLLFHYPSLGDLKISEKVIAGRMRALQKRFIKSRKFLEESRVELSASMKKIQAKDLVKFLNNQLSKSVECINTPPETTGWHKSRIHLKRVMYLSSLLTTKQYFGLKVDVRHPFFDQLQEELGQWHDLTDLRQHIITGKLTSSRKRKLLLLMNPILLKKEKRIQRQWKKITNSGLVSEFDES
jgi:CHAD domain-containing protein